MAVDLCIYLFIYPFISSRVCIGFGPRAVIVTTNRSTKKNTREMLKFCTSHDHTSGKLEPESVHDMITFQGGAALSNKGKFTEDV